MSLHEWRPAAFASHFRKQDPQPPIDRWEALLRAEQSLIYQLLSALSRTPLSGFLGIPTHLGDTPGPSLEEREARVTAVENTRLARGVGRLFRSGRGALRPSAGPAGEGPPATGPRLNHEVDAALELVTSMAFEEVQRRGWHVQPNTYYWPLNDLAFLRDNQQLWTEPKLPLEIDWDLDGQMELARRVANYAGELADVREGRPAGPGEFTWGQAFGGLDAYAYYGLLRELQPTRVVEVGIGLSSLLLERAPSANDRPIDVTLIDPGPPWHVLGELPEDWRVLPNFVHDVDPDVFSRLQAGDILFYDGSHCVRTGSDVNWMFFEILPRLAPGVWIHVHDLAWPRDYPQDWIFDEGLSWNEQYLVQAFLMHNPSFRVRLASVMLHHYQGGAVEALFPTDIGGASSLWLEKIS